MGYAGMVRGMTGNVNSMPRILIVDDDRSILDISRPMLDRKIEEYGLRREEQAS